MDDAGLVRVFERRRQLQRDVHHVLIRHRTAREAVGERGPVDELHDQGKAAARFLDPVNLRDVLMIERGERLRFAFEARQILGVRGDAREEHLDGDFAVESHVVGAIDLAHAAGPKGGDYLIRADPGTGCEWHADTDGLEAAKLSRMMRDRTRTLAAFLGVLVLAVLASPAAAQNPSGLQKLLDAELARFPARAGLWVKHLTTGEEAAVRADDTFNSASVIKIPVLVLAYQMAAKGELSLTERVTIRPEDVRGGSGIFRYHDAGLQPTVRDVLLQMVITSDNTATDLAIGKVGGVARVNAWLNEQGYDGMKLTQTTGDLFAKYGKLAAGASNEKTNTDRTYWLGEMTPRATGRMLEAIHSKKIVSSDHSDDIIRMMRAQQAGARRLPHFLSVPVAHKTGDFPPVLANDVGIVFARSGPMVISFFANAIEGPYGEAEDRMGQVARLIVEYFDGVR